MLANQVTALRLNNLSLSEHRIEATKLAVTLATQNIQSVAGRYRQDETDPAFVNFLEEVMDLTPKLPRQYFDVSAVQWLKTISCLNYQSCDHLRGEEETVCNKMRGHFISSLAGWDDAVWGAPKTSDNQPIRITDL
jgi:hypothetical protein|tara:strand:- start:395 stop:802 length:408 start_codon:yes stop_codon:yes gene_type:complete